MCNEARLRVWIITITTRARARFSIICGRKMVKRQVLFLWSLSFQLISQRLNLFKHPNSSFFTFIYTLCGEWMKSDKHGNPRPYFLQYFQEMFLSIYNILGIKLFVKFGSGYSQLREHKSRHNLGNILNPMCFCSLEPESISYYFYCVGTSSFLAYLFCN